MKYSAKANTLCAQPCYAYKAVGNKACVLALTKFWKEALKNYGGEEKFSAVIQGFDLHGDGKVDSIEVLE